MVCGAVVMSLWALGFPALSSFMKLDSFKLLCSYIAKCKRTHEGYKHLFDMLLGGCSLSPSPSSNISHYP